MVAHMFSEKKKKKEESLLEKNAIATVLIHINMIFVIPDD